MEDIMMAKKILALFIAVLMALSLTATALADVVWEPRNSFYETHHSQCTYLGRRPRRLCHPLGRPGREHCRRPVRKRDCAERILDLQELGLHHRLGG